MENLPYMFLGWLILFVVIEGPELLFRIIFRKDIKNKKNNKL